VYALTYAGRVRAWTGDTQPVRTLALEHVLALAEDGSVAVTAAKEGQHGDRVEILALPAATPLYHHSFEHGIEKVLAVSARAIALLVNTGYTTNPYEGIPQLPAPRWSFEMWSFTDDGIGLRGSTVSCDEHARFSADGLRFICAKDFGWVRWLDLESGSSASPELAIDWLPPSRSEREDELEMAPRGRPSISPPPYFLLSLQLSANGRDVFVAYTRMSADGDGPAQTSPGWRLERWTPAADTGRGSVARLATLDADAYTRLLAISGDASLAVLGSHSEPLVIRRAPGYEPQQLPAGASTAAAVSADGSRIVSGHQDGSLRLWDAASGRLLATAGL
jgi:hypothetical protein